MYMFYNIIYCDLVCLYEIKLLKNIIMILQEEKTNSDEIIKFKYLMTE